MAEGFEDPVLQGRLDKLARELQAAAPRLSQRLAEARELEQRATQRAQREDRRVVREERVTERKVAARGRGATTSDADLERERKATRLSEERARHEERARDAARARVTANAAEARYLPVRAADYGAASDIRATSRRAQRVAGIRDEAALTQRLQRQQEAARNAEARAHSDRLRQMRESRLLLPGAGQTTPVGASVAGLSRGEVEERARRGQLRELGGRPTPTPLFAPRADPQEGLRERLGGASQAERARVLADRMAQSNLRGAQTYQSFGNAAQYFARSAHLSGDSMRRHGALTTEFISAAARGRVEIRELGFQVGSTIAKFAGWTAAATSVFAVAAAVHQLGTGALDSLHGVNLLQRIIPNLDTERAQSQFRDLAREFNLPIEDVAAAAYGMSKIFQDQNSTFDATRQALFAVKVGELDAGTAIKTLTGIVNGFRLEADQLPAVFDTINEAQNRFGGNTGDISRGVAQAAGQFEAAGGSYRELISLIQTGTRLTGRSGIEIATAIQRMAEIVQRPNRRAQITELLGIDPEGKDIGQVLQAAFEKVQSVSRSKQQELVNTLATPQLAARLLPILRNRALYQEIYGQLSPGNVEGSADRELRRAIQSPREQLRRLGVELQAFGSAIGESGFLDPFVAFVRLLTAGVNLASDFTGAFASLPGYLRTALVYGGQLAAVMGLARRFNVGGPGGILARSPRALGRAQIGEGLDAEREYYREQRHAVTRRGGTVAQQIPLLTRQANQMELAGVEEQRVTATRGRITGLQAELNALVAEEAALVQAQNANQATTNRFRQRTSLFARNRLTPIEAARAEGIPFTQQLGTNVNTRPVPILRGAGDVQESLTPGGVVVQGARAAEQAEQAVRRDVQQTSRAAERIRDTGNRLGVSGRLAASGIIGAGSGVRAAGRGLQNLAGGFGRLGGSLLLSLGPLDAVLLAALAVYEITNQVKDRLEEEDKRLKAAQRARSPAELDAAVEKLGKPGFTDRAGQAGRGLVDATRFAVSLSPGGRGLANRIPRIGDQPFEREQAAADEFRQDARVLRYSQQSGYFLSQNEVRKRMQKRIREAKNDRELEKALVESRQEWRQSWAQTGGPDHDMSTVGAEARAASAQTRGEIEQALADVRVSRGNIAAALRSIATPDQAQGIVQTLQNRVARFGLTRNNRRAIGVAQARIVRQLAQRGNSQDDITSYLSSIDELNQTARRAIDEQLSAATAEGTPRGQAQAARGAAVRHLREATVRPVRRALRQMVANREAILEAIANLDRLMQRQLSGAAALSLGDAIRQGGAAGGLQTLLGRALAGATRDQIRGLRGHAAGQRRGIREIRAFLRRQDRELKAFSQEQEQAGQQDDSGDQLGRFDAATALLQSRTADPVAQARIAAARLRERIALMRQIGASAAELDQAMAEYNQSLQQLASAELSRFQAAQGLATARFSVGASQGAILRRQLSDARAYAGRVASYGDRVDPTELLNAQRAIYEAEKALSDYVRQQAEALIQAQGALRQSRTQDPVEQARIAYQTSRRLLQFAETRADRLQRRAEINNNRRAWRQSRQQEAYDDIQFQVDIGKISRDTQIRQLRALLRTIKGNRDLRRQIRRQIHQLEQESSDFQDLDVGNVKLPTLYELRRAVAAQARGLAPTQSYASIQPAAGTVNHYRTTVNVRRPADASLVGDQLERYHSGAGRALARAAGQA